MRQDLIPGVCCNPVQEDDAREEVQVVTDHDDFGGCVMVNVQEEKRDLDLDVVVEIPDNFLFGQEMGHDGAVVSEDPDLRSVHRLRPRSD